MCRRFEQGQRIRHPDSLFQNWQKPWEGMIDRLILLDRRLWSINWEDIWRREMSLRMKKKSNQCTAREWYERLRTNKIGSRLYVLCSLIILYSTCVIGWKYDELMIIEKINPPSSWNNIWSRESQEIRFFSWLGLRLVSGNTEFNFLYERCRCISMRTIFCTVWDFIWSKKCIEKKIFVEVPGMLLSDHFFHFNWIWSASRIRKIFFLCWLKHGFSLLFSVSQHQRYH